MPMVPVTNGELYFEEAGAGELIILLPGLGHDHTYFAKALPLLAGIGRVVTPDPRGLGQSSPAQSYSVEQWASNVLELIVQLGATRAHLVGSSLGACVCMQAALDAPARVASLSLVAGFSEVDPLLEMNFRTRLKILDAVGWGDVMASHVSMWTLGRSFIATAEGRAQMEKLFASVRKNSPERYRAFARPQIDRSVWPARGGGQSPRRRRCAGRAHCGHIQPRRPHAAVDFFFACDCAYCACAAGL